MSQGSSTGPDRERAARPLVALVRLACSGPVLRTATATSLVVGTVLNLVNHGSDLLDGRMPSSIAALALNYVVPFLVSTWSGAVAALHARG